MKLIIAVVLFLTIAPFFGHAQTEALKTQSAYLTDTDLAFANDIDSENENSLDGLLIQEAYSQDEDWIVDDLRYTEEELDYLEEIKQKKTRRNCDIRDGGASWYGPGFHGRRTANGERFDQNALTAAHKTLKFGSLVEVTYRGRSVVVRINDAGPFVRGRVIDLSRAAAEAVGLIDAGHGQVQLKLLSCGE